VGTAAVMLTGMPTAAAATMTVGAAAQLTSALAAANPGTVIELAANTTFTGILHGSEERHVQWRITLRGPRSAVLEASGDRGLELTGSYWTIDGFTVTGGKKGLMALARCQEHFGEQPQGDRHRPRRHPYPAHQLRQRRAGLRGHRYGREYGGYG
jgi:hypothetical protein